MAGVERTRCANCGASCFFVCRIGNDWVCTECFGAHAKNVGDALDAIADKRTSNKVGTDGRTS